MSRRVFIPRAVVAAVLAVFSLALIARSLHFVLIPHGTHGGHVHAHDHGETRTDHLALSALAEAGEAAEPCTVPLTRRSENTQTGPETPAPVVTDFLDCPARAPTAPRLTATRYLIAPKQSPPLA